MNIINMDFILSDYIKAGLESGSYIRKGGVIINSENGQIIEWLKEAAPGIPDSNIISLAISDFANVSLLTTAFVYMDKNFRKINKKLDEINLKIDEQILSKITSGISLAMQAEQIHNEKNRYLQLVQARTQLTEGINIYKSLFSKLNKKDKRYTDNLLFYIQLIIQSELVLARTYLLQRDFNLALDTLNELEDFYYHAMDKLLKKEFNAKTLNYSNLRKPRALLNDLIKRRDERDYTKDEILRLERMDIHPKEKFLKIADRAKEVGYEFEEETSNFIIFKEYLESYQLESKSYKENDDIYELNLLQ